MDPPILPGFTMSSGRYDVMFMTASQFDCDPCDINRVVKGIMDVILELAEFEDGNFEKIKSGLEYMLKYEWEAEQTTVNIFDEPFFPRPKGHMRKIKILDNTNNTTFEFSLARRTNIKTLKDLALNIVISNLTNHLGINKMEIPETLKMTLKKDFYNEWSRKRFPSYNITLLPFAESLKAGGIDARTLDLIMDEYMYRIELTRCQLADGFPDPNAMKEIVWERFFQEIARLGSPGLLHHLNQTVHILFQSPQSQDGPNTLSSFFPRNGAAIQEANAVDAMEQDLPLDLSLSLVPPRL